jgi:hypothetical protein
MLRDATQCRAFATLCFAAHRHAFARLRQAGLGNA